MTPSTQEIDGATYSSISHWGMFPQVLTPHVVLRRDPYRPKPSTEPRRIRDEA